MEHLLTKVGPSLHGDHADRARASLQHGERLDQARAFTQHGELFDQDRAFLEHGDQLGRARASGMDAGVNGLFDTGPRASCRLPGHGLGGGGVGDGQDRIYGPWTEGGSMNTRSELPDLPESSSPLQFGDWLHLSTPVMKDLSGVAGWWWESTLREASCYYEQWKSSTPLQRIQICPKLPEDLCEHKFQRTEQRGVQLLLKAIPEAEQQSLVTDRALSSTAILYKLLIRFQPGGAGEKQILLQQLTTVPKTTNVKDLAAALRNWRRHFGRAKEVNATLPDGVLLLKALDGPIQQLGAMDPQAAFRLAQSRMQLGLDERPTQQALWSYSQCLLAEAETLVLLQTNSLTLTPQTPLKLKQMQGDPKTPPRPSPGENHTRSTPIAEKPCKYFLSDSGCKAGKSCKWLHSWEGVTDKSSRCFICGGKDHRKADCKLRNGKATGEPAGSGGGNGHGRGGGLTSSTATSNSSTTVGGKAGAAATTKVINAVNQQDDAKSSTTDPKVAAADGSSSTTTMANDGKGGGGSETDVNAANTNNKTAELLHEATQLLKTLRVPAGNPRLKVMQIGGLDQVGDGMVLLDSGATHGLRPARDLSEWGAAEPTCVQLANGSTTEFKLKKGTKILLGHPTEMTSWIVPMGGLSDLDFKLEWKNGQCRLQDDEGREIAVTVVNGCPMITMADGRKILEWLELFYVHQWRKLAVVKTLMMDASMVDASRLDSEVAMTLKMKELFPNLPEEILMRLIPRLEQIKAEDFGSKIPWNRHKRRRLQRARNIIVHVFSGPNQRYWERQCSTAATEVLCVDTSGAISANMLDKNTFAYLLTLCASGRVKAVIGGPPCRTISALRYQGDTGPGVLRDDEYPYGLPNLSMADHNLVMDDVTLMFRFLALYVMAEEVREEDEVPTQFTMEQPEDPARYRSPQDIHENGYFSFFRTQEWKDFEERYNIKQVHMDQHPMGHKKRKPTTLATNMEELFQLNELRGEPADEAQASEAFRALPLQQRMQESKTWAAWAPGLNAAISTALNRHLQRLEGEAQQPVLRPLHQVALEAWKQHFLHDHLPARRDCMHCVRAQGRSRPHRRVTHPDAFTLSIDLSGRLADGIDQDKERCKYIMVACYTFPVTGDGRPLVEPPGVSREDHDHPLPSMDLHGRVGQATDPLPSMDLHGGDQRASNGGLAANPLPSMDLHGGDRAADDDVVMDDGGDLPPEPESADGLADPDDPLREQLHPDEQHADGPAQEMMRTAFDAWQRLVEDARDVRVKNLTFTEVVRSRAVKDVLPALARIYARLRHLGLPLLRIHCDRARELTSAVVRRWTLDRGVITTLTTGSSYKTNGRVEAEVGAVKRAVRTLISANLCPLSSWPLALRHVGERRLRSQLQSIGWPAAPLLKFGTRAYALKKSWQDRCYPWRDTREEVVVMGPDKNSSLTTTNYFVKSVATGRFFFTDDVVEPAQQPDVQAEPAEPIVFLPERQQPANPIVDGVPTRRLRSKTAVPAVRSMWHIEGEGALDQHTTEAPFGHCHVFAVSDRVQHLFESDTIQSQSDESSWSLGTDSDQTTASSQAETPTLQSDEEGLGGGEWEEAPNNRDGGSSPVASMMTGVTALRTLHANVVDYIRDEMNHLDAASEDQALWIGNITEAIGLRMMLEDQLQEIQQQTAREGQNKLDQEFLVTRTIGNAEVWANLEDWKPSICAEYEQLTNKKQAVKQISKNQLQELARQRGLPIELLPGKMVHTRKAGSGAFRSRAVVCGNYQDPGTDEVYAGGADGNQTRAQIRLASSKEWSIYGTDIRVAFLNAPRRDETKITAMEVPAVFRKLGLASPSDVWVIEKALYGLVGSPRDWCLYRDETLPAVTWRRLRHGREVEGRFIKTADENMWRMVETDVETDERHWTGLMNVYVDDLLVSAEDSAAEAALASIAKIWATSEVEKVTELGKPLKYCGFEIEVGPQGDGFLISQRMYEKEMVQKWGIERGIDAPHFKPSEDDENPGEPVEATDIKIAQGMAGALLWLTTRTRPDLAMSVSTVCRLATKHPKRSQPW